MLRPAVGLGATVVGEVVGRGGGGGSKAVVEVAAVGEASGRMEVNHRHRDRGGVRLVTEGDQAGKRIGARSTSARCDRSTSRGKGGPGQDRSQRGGSWPSKQASNPSFAAGGVQYSPRTRQEDRTREMLAMEGDMEDASPGSLSGLQRRGKKSWECVTRRGKEQRLPGVRGKSRTGQNHTRVGTVQTSSRWTPMGRRKDKQRDHPRDKKPQERIHAIPDDVTVLKFTQAAGRAIVGRGARPG